MTGVALSNAPVEARQPDTARPSVRRNLFGRPDPEEVRSYAEASIREDVQGFTETYNFDPVADRPLSSAQLRLQEDRDAPEFYVRPPHGRLRPRRDDGNDRRDAGERSERQAAQPNRGGSRKRGSGASGNFISILFASTH
uniref:Cyclin-dependent kinase inhibitor domain-containing protein n=1 Tax=Cyclopterus lumpus TaxID=8103 RepID=A0A8C2XU35_CYCLU